MISIKNLIKRHIFPDPRKSTIAHENFIYKIDSFLEDRGKTISDEEHRFLLDLYIRHKDKEIESFLKSL